MKVRLRIKYVVVAVSLTASCLSYSPLNFKVEIVSPRNTYRIKLEGREASLTSSVQKVKLTVFMGAETILVDDEFYREEVDHPFLKEFPAHDWISDSILRFANVKPPQGSADKIVVVNNGKRVSVLKVEYGSFGEKFLIFDLATGAKVELQVLSSNQYPNPNVSYTVYANGQALKDMATGWRKSETGSEILLAIARSPLTEIDLATVGAIAPKGRVQDAEYNHLPLVDQLIAHGRESIPYLISKLDDETKIEGYVVDFWNEVRVADVALIILTDFFTDHTWQNTTVPGVGWDQFLKRGANSSITAEQVLRNYISKHGRSKIKERWQQIWEKYRHQIGWDETERCFKPSS
jgi:hypothetical protein